RVRQRVDGFVERALARRLRFVVLAVGLGQRADGLGLRFRSFLLGQRRNLHANRLPLGFLRREHQRHLLLALGLRYFLCGLHGLLGLHRVGERQIGAGLRLRLLFRFLRDRDRPLLLGNLRGALLLDRRDLDFALGFDFALPHGLLLRDLGFADLALSQDLRLLGLTRLCGLHLGD